MIIRKVIAALLFCIFLLSGLVVINYSNNERDSNTKLLTHCQLMNIIGLINGVPVYHRAALLTNDNWFDNIGLKAIKSKCGAGMNVNGSLIYDSSGAEIRLERSAGQQLILRRVGEKYKEFFLKLNLTEYEFKTKEKAE